MPLCHPLMALHVAASVFTPTSITGCIQWCRGDLGISIGTGVKTWADQSGVGNNFVQNTGANQPTQGTAVNSQATIHFVAGSSQSMACTWVSTPTTANLFIVTKNSGTGGSIGLMHCTTTAAGNDAYFPFTGGSTWDIFENWGIGTGRVSNIAASSALTNAHVYEIRAASGTNGYLMVMDGTTLSTTTQTLGFGTSFTIGSNVSIPSFYSGDIAECIVYNNVIGSTDRSNLMTYLRGRYATP